MTVGQIRRVVRRLAPSLDREALLGVVGALWDFDRVRPPLGRCPPPPKRGLPLDRFLGSADAMLDGREFFVRQAIGWVLREEGKRRPDEVVAWLRPRTHRASGVTVREAVEYVSADDREALMGAYRNR